MFWEDFEGWRHPSALQNELLKTLEAGLGADDVNFATLRSVFLLHRHLGGIRETSGGCPGGPQILRPGQGRGSSRFLGAGSK